MLTENNEEETNYVLPGSLKAEAAERAKLASETDVKRKKSSRRSLRGGAPSSGKNSRANSRSGSRSKVIFSSANFTSFFCDNFILEIFLFSTLF